MTSIDEYADIFAALQDAAEDGDIDEMETQVFSLLKRLRDKRPDLLFHDDGASCASSEEDVKADEVQIGSLVKGGFTMFTDFPFEFYGVIYRTVMNAFQACKAANHDKNGIFIGSGYTSKDTLDVRKDYGQMLVGDANEAGRKVFIKDIRMWDSNKDIIMKEIIVTALKLDDPTHCKVDFTLMPTEDTRIVHFGPNDYYGVDTHLRTHDGYLKGNNFVGLIVTEYYNKWKNKKTSGSSSGSSSHFSASPPKKGKGKKAKA
jgi:predicted NAD-dependent protein-ADP-ribosyltransferase YbiA (DUF1768 family)